MVVTGCALTRGWLLNWCSGALVLRFALVKNGEW